MILDPLQDVREDIGPVPRTNDRCTRHLQHQTTPGESFLTATLVLSRTNWRWRCDRFRNNDLAAGLRHSKEICRSRREHISLDNVAIEYASVLNMVAVSMQLVPVAAFLHDRPWVDFLSTQTSGAKASLIPQVQDSPEDCFRTHQKKKSPERGQRLVCGIQVFCPSTLQKLS